MSSGQHTPVMKFGTPGNGKGRITGSSRSASVPVTTSAAVDVVRSTSAGPSAPSANLKWPLHLPHILACEGCKNVPEERYDCLQDAPGLPCERCRGRKVKCSLNKNSPGKTALPPEEAKVAAQEMQERYLQYQAQLSAG
ncbi:hypothetical protein EIP91_011569, partial [Steccherinum ochraceum]